MPEDEGCLASMWLKSYRHSRDVRESGLVNACVDGHADEIRFWKLHQPIVTWLLRNAAVYVACDPDRVDYSRGPAVILGWLCASPGRVHWVGIKRSFAAMGGGWAVDEVVGELRELAEVKTVDVSTFDLMDLRKSQQHRWRYDRGWLSALRSTSSRVLGADAEFVKLVWHLTDERRPEWRPESERAA